MKLTDTYKKKKKCPVIAASTKLYQTVLDGNKHSFDKLLRMHVRNIKLEHKVLLLSI